MLRTGDLNPHSFRKPTLYVYLLFGLFSIYYRIGAAIGVYSTPVAQLNATTDVYATMPEFFVIARLLTAAMAAVSIGAVYVIATRLWSRTAGLIAAVALATFAFHVRHSQLATLDVPSAAVVSLAFLGSLAIMQRGSWKAYLLAGLFV